jgi:hypothetical protein
VEKYKAESPQWAKTKPVTTEIYNRRLDYLQSKYGRADLATFTEKGVRRIRNNLKDRPSVADATVDMIGQERTLIARKRPPTEAALLAL